MFIAFTINDISTTYISFPTNLVGIVFDDSTNPATLQTINVDREGDWHDLTPGGDGFGLGFRFVTDPNPSIYSNVNVIQIPLPCCLCFSWSLTSYSIQADPTNTYDQIFRVTSMGSGGYVDSEKGRAYNYGLGYSHTITVYDLASGSSTAYKPDLCDVVDCVVDPCQSSTCTHNPTATCVVRIVVMQCSMVCLYLCTNFLEICTHKQTTINLNK